MQCDTMKKKKVSGATGATATATTSETMHHTSVTSTHSDTEATTTTPISTSIILQPDTTIPRLAGS